MDTYLRRLMEQYKSATGMKNVDVNSKKFIKGFKEWLIGRKDIVNKYIALLDYMELEYDKPNCAEVGKCFLDSIVIPFQTKIITSSTKGFQNVKRDKVIISDFKIYNGIPNLIKKNNDGGSTSLIQLSSNVVKTYITENPYLGEDIKNWEQLHNNKINNIIVGVFGNICDKDFEVKIKQLKELKAKLNDEYKDEYCTVDDSYYYVLASNRKK